MVKLSKQLAVYLTPGEKLELERLAILHKRKLSRLCRDVILSWIESQKEKIGDLDGIFEPLEDIRKNPVIQITYEETRGTTVRLPKKPLKDNSVKFVLEESK